MHHSPLVKDLCSALGGENVISAPSELQVYDCDAFTLKRNSPEVVVFPRSTEQVAAIMKISNQHSASIVPRGSGTGITGGCLPTPRSIVVVLTRLNRLLELNLRDRLAVVEAGATHCQLSKALAGSGYFYAPQSSGHGAGTIGGSVAANAGGPLSLKFGVTVNHILGLEAVLGDGSIVQLGPVHDPASFDLIGLLAGSEGTLGIITKAWLRLTPTAQDHRTIPAVFDSIDDAVSVVTQIIAAGMMPTATELIDQTILPLFNTELTSGIPPDAASVLLIQIEGTAATIDRQQERIAALCKQNNARAVLQTSPAHKDETAYKHRKSPLGAVGRLSPDYFIEDVAVPRAKLPSMLRIIAEIGQKHQLQIGNLAHLGDGTVESVILFDQRDSSTVDRALAAGNELLDHCIALGGSITTQHGIGVQKIDALPHQFKPADLEAMHRVRYSFDPYTRFNPGKLLPEKLYCLAPALVPGDRELFFPAQTENKHYPIITQTILPLAKTLAPADQADLSGAVRAAYGEKMAVYPIGGGTRLDYGTHPTKPGVGLSLENLNRLIDYQPDDLTITVQSGMTMAELAKILAQHGQRLPIDVAHPDLATVGGTAAVNPLGLGQFAQGTMRDCLLGFSAVDGQGMIFSGGARVLNNAAGYNMARLMAGSLGTLGILTQLTLSVRPLPEMSAFAACDLPDLNIAERLLMELMHTQPQPTAIELSLGPKRQDNPVLGPMPETSKLRLLVAFEGASEDVHPMLDALRQKCNIYRLTALSTVTGAASKQLWDWLMDFPAQVQITVRPSAVTKMIDALVALDPDCTIQAQAGSGILQAIFSSSKILPVEQGTSKQNNIALNGQEGRENATLHPFAIFLRTQLRPLLQSNPAKLVVLKQPENSNLTTRDVWGPRGDGFVVMQSLKDRFDPAGILNPGRYVFHDI